MKQYESNRITLKDLYLLYPYKTRDINSTTVPKPYFPKDQITDHEYSLKFKEWKKCIQCLLNNTEEYLHTGKKFRVPCRLGVFQIRKAKHRGLSYAHYRKTGEWVKLNTEYLKNYRPLFKWDKKRRDDCMARFRRIWVAGLTDSGWDKLMNKLNKNFSLINTFIDDRIR